MAGYSSTPLAKKLGYKPGLTVHLHHAPADYHQLLALDVGEAVIWCRTPTKGIQLVHAFTSSRAELGKLLAVYRKRIAPQACPPRRQGPGRCGRTRRRLHHRLGPQRSLFP